MKCYGCLTQSKEYNYINCSADLCNKTFCDLCIKLDSVPKERRNVWICPDCCATNKKGGDNSATPVRSANDAQNITLRKQKTGQTASTNPTNSEVKELTAELRLLTKEISSLKQRLEAATDSLTRCHVRLDELGVAVTTNESRIHAVEENTKELLDLRTTVTQLQKDLNSQAQTYLCNEIEIIGIPETQNENLHHCFLVAMCKLGADIEDSDVDWVSRAGPRKSATSGGAPRPVVARLLRKSKRDQILKASKTRRNLTSADIDIPGPSSKLYFNERLTRSNRMLFREARAKAKANSYTYCWCTAGTIYVRQKEGKEAMQVSSHQDLSRIFGSAPDTTSTKIA